jgi:hypothetical protein
MYLTGTLEGLIPRRDGMISNRGWRNAIVISYVCKKQRGNISINLIFKNSVTGDSTNLHIIHLLAIQVGSLQSGMEMSLKGKLSNKTSFKLLWNLHVKCLAKSGI